MSIPPSLAFEGHPVRIVDRDEETWFVAGDVARILGYEHTPHLVRSLDDDEKGVHAMDTPGGEQMLAIVSEPGLYRAIVQRRASESLPVEKREGIARFQRWVFHDVLPSIRKTGSYTAPAAPRAILPKDVASAFRSFASIGKLIGLDKNQTMIAANQATLKMTGINALELMGTTHLIAPRQEPILTPTQIGEALGGMSAKVVNGFLAERGFQVNGPGGWEPTDKGVPFAVFQDTGKRHGYGTPIRQLKWSAGILAELAAPTEDAA